VLTLTPITETREMAVAHLVANLSREVNGEDSLQLRLVDRIQVEPVSTFTVTQGEFSEAHVTSYVSSKRFTQPAEGDDEGRLDTDLQFMLQLYFLSNPADSVILHPTIVELRKQHDGFAEPFYVHRGTNVMCVLDQSVDSAALDEAITDCDQSACDMLSFSFVRAARKEVLRMSISDIARHVHLVATHAFDREGFVFVRFDEPTVPCATPQ